MRKPKTFQTPILERALGKRAFQKLLKKYDEARRVRKSGEPTEEEKKALAFYLANDVSMLEAARQYGIKNANRLYVVALWVLKNQERL